MNRVAAPMFPNPPAVRRAHLARRGGFSLVEVILVMAILTVSAAIYGQTIASSRRLEPIAIEKALASEAARTALERIRALPIDQVLALYDADPANDPGGAGTAPGATFAVEGLAPGAGGAAVGRIEFPFVDGRLAEDLVDDMFGFPRDINGDGEIDALDHRADWVLLPVRVRVEWTPHGGAGSTREFEIYTMLPRL